MKRAPKARVSGGGGFGGMIPHKFCIFRASEMTFSVFSWGKVYKSEHQKTLTIQIGI